MSFFGRFGFEVVSSRGSHAKLRRYVGTLKQTITVPLHDELDTVPSGLSSDRLLPTFPSPSYCRTFARNDADPTFPI